MKATIRNVGVFIKRQPRKRIILVSVLAVLAIAAGTFAFTLFKVTDSVGNAFQGNAIQALTSHDPLKQDTSGRTSILIFGDSSDDAGHGGALLSDSIMVLTIDQKTHKAHSLSVPRDLWVQYGQACANGSEGKINAYYQCALKNNGHNPDEAGKAFAQKVGSILGVDLQYYAKVNYGFVKEAVDAVSGVDVVIKSDDPRGILDRNFDTKCPDGPYTCYYVKYENGPVHLDGIHALYLSRARNAKGGYGLPQSNFDREVNQQLIMDALQKKALSIGILSNPLAVIKLADSFGDNISTNIQTSELRSAVDALQAIGTDTITSISLNDADTPLVTTGSQSSQSIVLPTAGLYSYEQIQAALQKALAK